METKISLILMFLILVTSVRGQLSTSLKDSTQRDAERVWELAVQAQGGREKLLTMRNLVISSTGNFRLGLFKKYTNQDESLYVFPNKMWAWEDYRPSAFGLTMRMYNWETGEKYVFSPSPKIAPSELIEKLKPIEQIDINGLKDKNGNVVWTKFVIYLLESKWWKPIPETISVGQINGKKVDIIQTTVDGKKVDFFLSQENHLPVRISFHNFNEIMRITEINSIDVSDYVEIAGLKMPAKMKDIDGNKVSLTYQFNVEYNESIFQTPPPFNAGLEAWKAIKTKN